MVGTQGNSASRTQGNGSRGSVRTPSGATVPAMQAWARFAQDASVARAAGDEEGIARALASALVVATNAVASTVAWRRGHASEGAASRTRTGDSRESGEAGGESASGSCASIEGSAHGMVAEGLPGSIVDMLASVPLDAEAIAPLACSPDEVLVRPLASCVALDGQLVLAPLAGLGISSIATVPMRRHDGGLIGIARIYFREPASEIDVDRPLLGHFARQIACALDGIALELALGRSESALTAVFDASREALVELGADARVRRVNAAAERMLGYRRERLVGLPASILVSPRHAGHLLVAPRGMETVHAAGSHPEPPVRDSELVRADGTLLAAEVSLRPVAGGGAMIALRDVRERHAAEEHARESDRLAAMGTLAAGLGHDMNNVLFPIRAHVNALSAAGGRMPARKRAMHVAEIRHSVAYLQQLADSLHFLSMDPDGDGDGSASTDLAAWWSGCGPLLVQSLRRRAVLSVDLAGELPAVAIAPHALTRAMLNLLVNAAEAMPDGRAADASRVVLRARPGASGATVVVELEDNGTGMSDEIRRQAIDMFFTTKPRGLGTGLGLPLVRRVVERAGGRLEIDSRVGGGTTMRLVLVAVEEGDDGAQPVVARIDLADGRVRALVSALVETKGCTVADPRAGTDGSDATLWIVDGERLDDGAYDAWRRRAAPARIVSFGDPAAAEAAGAVCRVALPLDLETVARALDRALAEHPSTAPEHEGGSES